MSMESRAKRRRRVNIFVPTASMGDIAFLLIIFFMLTSKFMQESHVKYEEAESPDIVKLDDASISVIVDEQGAIWLMGKPCYSPEELRLAVEAMVDGKKNVSAMIKIDRNLQAKQYSDVLVELGKTGVRFNLVGTKSGSYLNTK